MNDKMPHTPFSTGLSRSAKETKIRLQNIFSGPKKRPPVLFLALMCLIALSCGDLVSCQVKEAEAPDAGGSSSLADLPDPPEQKPEMEIQEHQVVLGDLEDSDLDGDGLTDTVTATTRFDPQDESGSTIITLTVALGRGETVEHQWTEENHLSIAVLMAESVISPDRDALVLGLEVFGSNYGAAETYIFELTDGSLTERYRTENASTISGTYLTYHSKREGSSLNSVRIPVLVDKWHAPEYYTLSWNGTGWDFVGDGYFTDAETVTVTGGRVLTLALRGRATGEQFGPRLIYDQIQVFDGDMMFNPDMLLQTIVPEDIPADGRFPDQIFLADGSPCVLIQDIDCDGAEDFAVSCDQTKNMGRRWFRWNEGQGRFEYGFSLAGTPEVVPVGQRVIEECWTEDWESTVYHVYGFNNRGWLIQESTWDTLAEARDACEEENWR